MNYSSLFMRPYRLLAIFALLCGNLSVAQPLALKPKLETATFAAGCFWGTEEFFRKVPGVVETQVGYTGGPKKAHYEEVSGGATGHAESLELKFDPKQVSYETLLTLFFKMHDPTTPHQQGNDIGSQYRSAIFTHSDAQMKAAVAMKEKVEKSGAWKKPLTTEIVKAGAFYPAEEEHQKYLVKHPGGYDNHYLRELNFDSSSPPEQPFKKPDQATLKKQLNSLQYEVTQEEATEPPFRNEYVNNHREGIYVDVVSGEPLFSSKDKYESGTGWPSFTQPLVKENVVTKKDKDGDRDEVRSKYANSHLGHVFEDGPPPTGLRYCMNSASLRFIPAEDLDKSENKKLYGKFSSLFMKATPTPTKKKSGK